jgi:hypothetical protein
MKSFEALLKRLRTKGKEISLDEITKEVELVRSKRYDKKRLTVLSLTQIFGLAFNNKGLKNIR